MRAGLEACRWCGTRDHPSNPLTVDHIVPLSSGGGSTLDNVTILCSRCNTNKDDDVWDLESLAAEEAAAPPSRRWAALVCADVHRRRYECPHCGGMWLTDQSCRLVPHPSADGTTRCSGFRTRMPDDSVAAVLALAVSGPRRQPDEGLTATACTGRGSPSAADARDRVGDRTAVHLLPAMRS